MTYPRLHQGHDGSLGSFEYLVYENVLRSLGEAAGLQPVFDYGDEQLERMLDPVSSTEAIYSRPSYILFYTRCGSPHPDMMLLHGPVPQADERKLLKHFLPHFDGADPSLEQASALFTTFCFRKPEAEPAADDKGQESVPEASDPPVPGAGAHSATHVASDDHLAAHTAEHEQSMTMRAQVKSDSENRGQTNFPARRQSARPHQQNGLPCDANRLDTKAMHRSCGLAHCVCRNLWSFVYKLSLADKHTMSPSTDNRFSLLTDPPHLDYFSTETVTAAACARPFLTSSAASAASPRTGMRRSQRQ